MDLDTAPHPGAQTAPVHRAPISLRLSSASRPVTTAPALPPPSVPPMMLSVPPPSLNVPPPSLTVPPPSLSVGPRLIPPVPPVMLQAPPPPSLPLNTAAAPTPSGGIDGLPVPEGMGPPPWLPAASGGDAR